MATVRYLQKFENSDGSESYTFPTRRYQWQPQQGVRDPFSTIAGAGYAFRHLQEASVLKNPAQERVRFIKVDTAANIDTDIDDLREKLVNIGLGKLWTIGADSSLRWAWAAISEMPEVTVESGQAALGHQPVILGFTRYSNWFAENETSGSATIDETPETFSITNSGNAPVYAIVFRLRSSSASGFTDPSLTNDTNGLSFSSTRDAASSDDELRVDTETGEVQYSDDDGSSYSNDLSNFSRGSEQVEYMRLEPGVNNFTYTDGGTPNATLEWAFYPAYH